MVYSEAEEQSGSRIAREQITAKVRQGLLPALGVTAEPLETQTRPTNEEAYNLYLRSAALPHDALPNKEAIAMLERSAGLDGKYAPTWLALGLRYYFESQYSSGGEENFKRSNAACERALALDPNLTFAASQLITNRVERGELAKAYEQARSLLKRRPESALAHFTLAYVDRYSGMLLDSTRECEVAKKLDPGNFYYRSCMWAFLYLGQPTKAREFVALDAGSEWANWVMPSILLREGKINEAREAARRMPTGTRYERELTEAALHTMRLAIDQNYCALSALENDPLLSPSRPTAEFAELLKAARSCQQPVMAEAGQSQ